jgi:hypothetical protein
MELSTAIHNSIGLANGVSGSQETLIPFDIICPSNIPYPNY